ncbi:MAG: hypothetical protein DI535_22675 [Citrobacter freundii]|nr:MAG: hypothetical protein DI535_22675 [Citrobacter freundii]
MKLNILSKLALGLTVLAVMAGCDKAQDWPKLGDAGQTIVKIPSDDDNSTAAFVELKTAPQSISLLEVRRDVVSQASLNSTMKVTLSIDDALVTDYDPDLLLVPSGGIVFDAANPANGNDITLTFAPQEFVKYIQVNVPNGTVFDPNELYGMGFKLKSVDQGGKVSAAKGEVVVVIGAKNAYDGVYKITSGTVQRYSAPGIPTTGDALNGSLVGNPNITLSTVDANSVQVSGLTWFGGTSGIGGIDNLKAKVDPATNLVTMSAGGNATLTNIPGSVNKYDPATKTFTLNFYWNPSANVREIKNLVLVYSRSR